MSTVVKAYRLNPALDVTFNENEVARVADRPKLTRDVQRTQSGVLKVYDVEDPALRHIALTLFLHRSDTIENLRAMLDLGSPFFLWPRYNLNTNARYEVEFENPEELTELYYGGWQRARAEVTVNFVTLPEAYIMVGRHRVHVAS